jgi:hypothetical protein
MEEEHQDKTQPNLWQSMNGSYGGHSLGISPMPVLSRCHPMGVRTVPVVRTRPGRARGARSLSDASVCVPLGEADLVVVSRRACGTPCCRLAGAL